MGGSGLVMAAGPNPAYVPKTSALIGPATVAHNGTANYILRVTFTNNVTLDFPPTMGATFTTVFGTITSGGVYTAPATGNKDRVTGSFAQNGSQTTSSTVVTLSP